MEPPDPQPTCVDSPWLVPFDGSFRTADFPTGPPEDAPGKKDAKRELKELVLELSDLQRRLYAENRRAILAVFQAMDAAGKDSTIRAVTSGVDPSGFQVASFKAPSPEELDHDFLWRTACRLPERGRIGVFNRSWYEEVLVVRVHPAFLEAQRLPHPVDPDALGRLWAERYQSIRDHERHLARNGTVVVKFWLHVSHEEQRRRFLSRLETPRKMWKFSEADVAERKHWAAYDQAYEDALGSTARPWAPWYAVPADSKPYMRLEVARILRDTLAALDPQWPEPDGTLAKRMKVLREKLESEKA